MREVLARRAPRGIEARGLHWSSYFHIHHRRMAQLRVGRIFLAGDAAHIHSPFGGQGMNTGLHDVWNLVWKLGLFLHGHGNQQLLDSYSVERLPIIKSVIETVDFLTRAMGTPNRFAQALRDAIIPMVSRLAPFQHAFVRRLSELGIAYQGSPIVEGPGERYFDDSMRGGTGIAGRFLLLVDEKNESPASEAARELSQSYSDVLELRHSGLSGVKLVRPDGYLAYSAGNGGRPAVLQAVRSVLARQTKE
ncbi:MAG: FAD-dependent monooxygenase [Bryobacteraceae bacterium]